MSLKDRITEDMKAAMRAKDAPRLLDDPRPARGLKQREVDERIVLDDAAVVAIVDKLVKQRKDSIAAVQRRRPPGPGRQGSRRARRARGLSAAAARRRRDRRRSRRASSPRSARRARPTWARRWPRRRRASPARPTWRWSRRPSRRRSRADARVIRMTPCRCNASPPTSAVARQLDTRSDGRGGRRGLPQRRQQPPRLRGRTDQPTNASIEAAARAAGLAYAFLPVAPS